MRPHVLVVAAFFFAASPVIAQPPPTTAAPAEHLELSVSTPDHIAGTYDRGGTRVHFDVRRTAEVGSLELRSGTNRVLFRGRIDQQSFTMTVLDGRLTAKGRTPTDPKTVPSLDSSGDLKALEDLKESPEYRLLPYLSRALGARGITGRSHPASLGLHFFGMASAKAHGVKLPPLEKATQTSASVSPAPGAQCYDQTNPKLDPCGDDCFGMCGPHCNCWSWVCGDCCVNSNCLLHDELCSQCQCGKGNCFLCYVPLTVLIPSPGPAFLCQWQSNPCPNNTADCGCANLTSCSQISGTNCGWCVADLAHPLESNRARAGGPGGPTQGKCRNWIWDHNDCDCAAIPTCPQIEGTHCGWCSVFAQAMPGSSSGPKYQPAFDNCSNVGYLTWYWDHKDCPPQ